MRICNFPLISTPQALNVSSNSSPQSLQHVYTYSIQIVITGTPTGTVKLQASADPVDQIDLAFEPPVNWTDIANTSTSVSAAGSVLWNQADVGYNWVRIVYTDSSSGSSTATMTAIVNTKGI